MPNDSSSAVAAHTHVSHNVEIGTLC